MSRALQFLSGVSFLVLTSIGTAALPAHGATTVRVVATFPVLKDFIEKVGRERVSVVSLLSGMESEHTYSPKPSDIVAVREANLLVVVGLGLEVWVERLVANAGNRNLTVVTTSNGVALIRGNENHLEGDNSDSEHDHKMGNPHIWLDPRNARVMTRQITDALIRIDPAGKGAYLANQAAFFRDLDSVEARLVAEVKMLRDRRIVVHHAAWPYFARRFAFQIRDTILQQVGAEPSAQRISALIDKIKKERIRVVVSEPQLNQKLPLIIARETGARLVVLTPMPGGVVGTGDYILMLEYNVNQLVSALKG